MLSPRWLQENCQDIIQQNKDIWIAYSGGVDSHVLLHLASLAFANVSALHINHGLSLVDNQWQLHCEQICTQLNIPLRCIKVDAQPNSKQSREDAARIARRNAWQDNLGTNDILLLAHHADDQAETILYRLFRGSGPKGLSGMSRHSKLSMLGVYRPLLDINKQQLLNYAMQENLAYINDHTNVDVSFDRNFIRQQIMPELNNRWPAVAKNINRAGKLNARLLQCLEPAVQEKLTDVLLTNQQEIDLTKLQNLPPIWRSEVLRAWLQQHDFTASYSKIKLIQQEVIDARADASPQLVLGNLVIRRSNNKLYVVNTQHEAFEFESEWDLAQDLILPNGKVLTVAQITDNKYFIDKLRTQQVTIKLGVWGPKAKKLFQQHDIPTWQRGNYPLVFAGPRLVAIVALWVSPRF